MRDQRIEFEYIDLELQPADVNTVLELNDGKQIIPTIVFPDGSHLVEPDNGQLAQKLGLTREAAKNTYDVVIIGGRTYRTDNRDLCRTGRLVDFSD